MRVFACFAFVLLTAGCTRPTAPVTTNAVTAPSRIDDELAVRPIAGDAWVVTHEPFFASNVLVVRMPDGTVVVCSSPFETKEARALVRWVKGTLSPARIVAINTHFHFDGTGGNEAYRELGVETWSSTLTRTLLLEKGEAMKASSADDFEGDKRARVVAMKVVPAERTFPDADGTTFRFGGEEVRVVYPGPGHSPDNLVVFFPSIGVLFGGCMIKGSRSIGFIGHADLDHWAAAVDVARGLHPAKVVPGHGPPGGPELFDLTVDVVRAAQASAQASGR